MIEKHEEKEKKSKSKKCKNPLLKKRKFSLIILFIILLITLIIGFFLGSKFGKILSG